MLKAVLLVVVAFVLGFTAVNNKPWFAGPVPMPHCPQQCPVK